MLNVINLSVITLCDVVMGAIMLNAIIPAVIMQNVMALLQLSTKNGKTFLAKKVYYLKKKLIGRLLSHMCLLSTGHCLTKVLNYKAY